MNWKDELGKYEKFFGLHQQINWLPVINLVQRIIKNNPNDANTYIRVIYFLHNILVEEEYSEHEEQTLIFLLKKYFDESRNKFSNNAEYLFFIGKILHVAEWYFGINEGSNPLEQTLAFSMQKKAFDLDPNNKLYEWSYFFSKGEAGKAYQLAQYLLYEDRYYLSWLKDKGFPGYYVIESLKYCHERYAS